MTYVIKYKDTIRYNSSIALYKDRMYGKRKNTMYPEPICI